MRKQSGFTMLEMMIVVAVILIIASIAVPNILNWLPQYRLKFAVRDLYSNIQKAKMIAIKANADSAIVFNAGAGSYQISTDPGQDSTWGTGDDIYGSSPVILADKYLSGVGFGSGNATDDIPGHGAPPPDPITYNNDMAIFNPQGTCNSGYVYLENLNNDISYGVGTLSSGVVRLWKWYGSNWEK